MNIQPETMWAMAHMKRRKPFIIYDTVSRTRKDAIRKVEKIIGKEWRPFSRKSGAKIIKVRVEIVT